MASYQAAPTQNRLDWRQNFVYKSVRQGPESSGGSELVRDNFIYLEQIPSKRFIPQVENRHAATPPGLDGGLQEY